MILIGLADEIALWGCLFCAAALICILCEVVVKLVQETWRLVLRHLKN
jgi:hypothetical protein